MISFLVHQHRVFTLVIGQVHRAFPEQGISSLADEQYWIAAQVHDHPAIRIPFQQEPVIIDGLALLIDDKFPGLILGGQKGHCLGFIQQFGDLHTHIRDGEGVRTDECQFIPGLHKSADKKQTCPGIQGHVGVGIYGLDRTQDLHTVIRGDSDVTRSTRWRFTDRQGIRLKETQLVQVEHGRGTAGYSNLDLARGLGGAATNYCLVLGSRITVIYIQVRGIILTAEGDHFIRLDLDAGIIVDPGDAWVFSHQDPSRIAACVKAAQYIHVFSLQVDQAALMTHDQLAYPVDMDTGRGDQLNEP